MASYRMNILMDARTFRSKSSSLHIVRSTSRIHMIFRQTSVIWLALVCLPAGFQPILMRLLIDLSKQT